MTILTKSVGQLTSHDIERLLPHRHPMRFVDTVVEAQLGPSPSIVATKMVREHEACFDGHYPGHPIFPGVLILEGLAQAGLLLFQLAGKPMQPEEVPVLSSTEGRFLKPVFPGDMLIYRVQIDKKTELAAIFHGTAEVNDTPVAKGEFVFGVKPWATLSQR